MYCIDQKNGPILGLLGCATQSSYQSSKTIGCVSIWFRYHSDNTLKFINLRLYKNNGKILIHKKRWNTGICNNVNGSWEYHVKQNKSDRKGQEPYDFTHVWYKTENNKWISKTRKKTRIVTDNSMVVYQSGKEMCWGDGEGKGVKYTVTEETWLWMVMSYT